MIKIYASILFIFSTIYVVSTSNVNITDVYFDKKLDIIFHKGKLYLPKIHPLFPNEFPEKKDIDKNQNFNQNYNNNSHGNQKGSEKEHEHELVSGRTFWIYVFIIFCK
jgi:hypothetical protein